MRTNRKPRIEIANADAFPSFPFFFSGFCFSFFLFFSFSLLSSRERHRRGNLLLTIYTFMEGNGYPDRTTGGDVAIDSSDWADQWRTLMYEMDFNCFCFYFYFFSY
jgi:hypothetical protein